MFRWARRRVQGLAIWVLWAMVMCVHPTLQASEPQPTALLLAVEINGQAQVGDVEVQQWPDGSLALPEEACRRWRFRLTQSTQIVTVAGERLVRIHDLKGVGATVDVPSQTLKLTVPPQAFQTTELDTQGTLPAAPATDAAQTGGFFNYDLLYQAARRSTGWRAGLEWGYFNPHGSGITTAIVVPTGTRPEVTRLIRLDSSWQVDDPAALQTWVWGDAISQAGLWGLSNRFAGLHWGSNFQLQSGFVAFPQPQARGSAALPSTVDVYVNNVQRLSADVPAGPFELRNLPVVTGPGEVRLVIRDALGREQLVTVPYFASAQLLKPGLHEFSVDLGLLRRDYGVRSMAYGPGVVVLTDRLGVSGDFTREWRLEAATRQQSAGWGGVLATGGLAQFSTHLAASRVRATEQAWRQGLQWGGAIEHVGSPWSLGLQARLASREFARVGDVQSPTRISLSTYLGWGRGAWSWGLTTQNQRTWLGQRIRSVALNGGVQVAPGDALNLYALHNRSDAGAQRVWGLNWVHVLDERTSVNAGQTRQGDARATSVQVQRSPKGTEGLGWRLQGERGGDTRNAQASAFWRAPLGDFTTDWALQNRERAYRVGYSGGTAWMGGGWFTGRRVDDSFAVVKVADFEGVRISRDNQEVGRTNDQGLVLVPRLLAHQPNGIQVEAADLPMGAEVPRLSSTVSPGRRSGVFLNVGVQRVRSAVFQAVEADGQPLPAGLALRSRSTGASHVVGYDGQVFITDLRDDELLDARLVGRACVLGVGWPRGGLVDPNGPMDLGVLTCQGSGPRLAATTEKEPGHALVTSSPTLVQGLLGYPSERRRGRAVVRSSSHDDWRTGRNLDPDARRIGDDRQQLRQCGRFRCRVRDLQRDLGQLIDR